MSYGVQLIGADGFVATSVNSPVFVVDLLRPTTSGSTSYPFDPASEGFSVVLIRDQPNKKAISAYSISGSTISWTVIDDSRYDSGPNVLVVLKTKKG